MNWQKKIRLKKKRREKLPLAESIYLEAIEQKPCRIKFARSFNRLSGFVFNKIEKKSIQIYQALQYIIYYTNLSVCC